MLAYGDSRENLTPMSETKIMEITAFAWDAGEQPAALRTDEPDFDHLQRELYRLLDTKEFGKIIRSYPSNNHVVGGELSLWYRAFDDPFRGRQIVSGMDEDELTQAYEAHKILCARQVFTPDELYALKPIRVDYGCWHTINVHFSSELACFDLEFDDDALEQSQRMETRTIVDHDYDGRRGWTLETIWFDKKPVMVANSSGRDGDEYHERWITDAALFAELITFLRSFALQTEATGFVKAADKIPAMTEFYNHTIHDYYDVEHQKLR